MKHIKRAKCNFIVEKLDKSRVSHLATQKVINKKEAQKLGARKYTIKKRKVIGGGFRDYSQKAKKLSLTQQPDITGLKCPRGVNDSILENFNTSLKFQEKPPADSIQLGDNTNNQENDLNKKDTNDGYSSKRTKFENSQLQECVANNSVIFNLGKAITYRHSNSL